MNSSAVIEDFSCVTERPGQGASASQLAMMAARYGWAARIGAGKDVLEAACGAGMGLSMIATTARSVTAGDVDETNLEDARVAFAGDSRITLRNFDAARMPFEAASFDVVLLFEAVYYLPDLHQFLTEAKRVLRPGGRLLLVTVNPEWRGFNPSPFSRRYFSATELGSALSQAGFRATIEAAFPEQESTLNKIVSAIRTVAVKLHLIPRTQRGKQFLKQLFYGRLTAVPQQLPPETQAEPDGLIAIDQCGQRDAYKVLYIHAQVQSSS